MQGTRVHNSGPGPILLCLWIAQITCFGQMLAPFALQNPRQPIVKTGFWFSPKQTSAWPGWIICIPRKRSRYYKRLGRLLNATDPLPTLAGKCVTGGRLNLRKALSPFIRLTAIPTARNAPFQLRVSADPNQTGVIEVSTNLTSWSPIFTNTTSANGTFEFTDRQFTNSTKRFYRAVSEP